MKRLLAAFVTGLLLISTRANAQVKQGTQQATVNLGLANPLSNDNINGDDEPFGKIGPSFGLGYLYQFRKQLSFGADLNYKRLGSEDVSTGHGPAEIKSSAWTLLAIARGDLMPDNNIRPYGLLGFGVGGVKSERTYSENPRFDSSRDSSGLAFALGGGVDYDINAVWLAGAEMRYNIIGTSESEIGADSISTFDILFKVGYKF